MYNVSHKLIISHDRNLYYGIQEKIDSLPHFLGNLGSIWSGVQAAAKINQQSPTAGKLWQGTPISNALVGKAAAAPYTPPKPQVKSPPTSNVPYGPVNPGTSSSTYNTPSTTTPQNNQQPYQNINQAADDGNAQIDADYNQSMAMLDQAASGLQGQAGTATAQITNDAAGVRTSLGAEQATGEQGVQSSLSTAEKQGTSAMQQARDLFRQTQQSNNAQLSALGISSSSVSEALAERLGVETARRIAGVTGSVQEVRQNAVNELGRIKTYYAEKKTQLDENVRIQKDRIQQALMAGLNQINAARSQAASDKAAARSNLLSQVQNQIYTLTTQQQQFDQSLKQWATQKSAALTPIAQDPNYINNLIATAQNFNEQFAPTGFGFTPEVSYDKYGTMTGKIVSNKKTDDELLANPFAAQ